MTRDEIFDQDRNERAVYSVADDHQDILLPLTKDGFEALLERATAAHSLPVDDRMRQVLAGYVHHIPNEQNTTTINTISKMLYKSVSNTLTWKIDESIKEVARKEFQEKLKQKELEAQSSNVVAMPEPRTESEGLGNGI